jgi:DNA-binding NarL/FixJ family response regulator
MNEHQERTRILIADDHPVFRTGLRAVLESNSDFIIVGEASNGTEAVALARETLPDILLLDVNVPLMSASEVLREVTSLDKGVRVILLAANITRNETVYALQLGARGLLGKNSAASVLLNSIRCVMNDELWVTREIVVDLVDSLRRIPAFQTREMEDTSRPPALRETRIVPLPEPKKGKASEHAQVFPRAAKTRKFGLTAREMEVVNAIVDGQSNRDIAQTYGITESTVKHHLTRIFDKIGVYSRLELALFALRHDLSSPIDQTESSGHSQKRTRPAN